MITTSYEKNDIQMSEPVAKAMAQLRRFMFERVYQNREAKSEEKKAEVLVQTLYDYYRRHLELLPEDFIRLAERGEARERVVCDYIGAMTALPWPDTRTFIFPDTGVERNRQDVLS